MNMLVAASGVAAAMPVLGAEADPIFVAIAKHRERVDASSKASHVISSLNGIIPEERRENWHVVHRGTNIGQNDDPRWTAAQNAYWASSDEMDDAAVALLNCEPTSIAGAIGLMRYIIEHVDHFGDFTGFPDGLLGDGDECSPEFFVMKKVADALTRLTA
jgi:hypothetical protein